MSPQRLVRRRQFTHAALAGALAAARTARAMPAASAPGPAQGAQGGKLAQRQDAPVRTRQVSAATQEAAFRNYGATLSQRIEDVGTRHYPTVDGRSLDGQLSLSLTVDTQGRLVAAGILRGSGNPLLDQQALAVASSAAPFVPFSDAMRRNTDQVVLSLNLRFDAGSPVGPRVSVMP